VLEWPGSARHDETAQRPASAALLENALRETFPASDPVSMFVPAARAPAWGNTRLT
jgi:hypothetical protein